MKISINVDEALNDTEISISCSRLTPEIEKIIATLRILNQQLAVTKDGEIFVLDVSKIVYIESVERKTFVYTESDVYESDLRLYEIQERLCESGFFRASKSCIVQLCFIRSLKADIDRRIRVSLENGENGIRIKAQFIYYGCAFFAA